MFSLVSTNLYNLYYVLLDAIWPNFQSEAFDFVCKWRHKLMLSFTSTHIEGFSLPSFSGVVVTKLLLALDSQPCTHEF